MTVLEIVLVIVGALIFVGSFFAPINREQLHEDTKKLAADEVKGMVALEMEQTKSSMAKLSEEAVQEQIQKAERSMERISNEKIMAVNEYSDTVLEEIHKNHQEVVFMYDMLNDKQGNLKETIAQAQKDVSELLQQVKDSEITVQEGLDKQESAMQSIAEMTAQTTAKLQTQEVPFVDTAIEESSVEPVQEKPDFKPFAPKKVEVVPKKTRKTTKTKKTEEAKEKEQPVPKTEGTESTKRKDTSDLKLEFSSSKMPNQKKDSGINSNERILELHKAGKSNMAIAKELGLGIGEVKLVIDLYEGMR